MKRIVVALAIASSLVGASRASADWQNTKWGMTPTQVIAACEGKAMETTAEEKRGNHRPAGPNTDVLLKMPFESGRFQFVAFFRFSSPAGRLVGVDLQLQNVGLSDELREALDTKYGRPEVDIKTGYVFRAEWRTTVDLVTYSGVPPRLFSLNYAPLATKDNEGL
jgi:hypothetical protein